MSGWQRCARDVEHHGDERVIAVHADQIHHPLFAKRRDGTRVRVIGHAAVPVQLGAEVVDDLQALGQVVEAPAGSDGVDNGVAQAGALRIRRMDVPFVWLRPATRLEQNRELADVAGQRAAIAKILSHSRGMHHQLRAAAERHERSEDVLIALRQKLR
jgi:hypothetical protein